MRVGDTAPRLDATLRNAGGTAQNIQGATVAYRVAPISGGTLTVAGTAVIDQNSDGSDGTLGMVHIDWPAAFQTSGVYLAMLEVTYASGLVESFPNDRNLLINVTGSL